MRIIIIISFLLGFINVYSQEEVNITIPEKIIAKSIQGRINTIEFEIIIKNPKDTILLIRKPYGIIPVPQMPFLDNTKLEDIPDTINLYGHFNINISDEIHNLLFNQPKLSLGEFPYFTKNEKLKVIQLGVDNLCLLKSRMKKYDVVKNKYSILKVLPKTSFKIKLKCYLGNYHFEKNSLYLIQLAYSNNSDNRFSRLFIKSNNMILYVE